MYLNYVILPVGNLGLTTYFTLNPNYDLKVLPLESWVIFFTIVCFSRLVEFFGAIKKIVLDDARIFLATKKQRQQQEAENREALIQDPDTQQSDKTEDERRWVKRALIELTNDDNSYMDRVRQYGEGEKRIGQTISLNDDIYSIGFISKLSDAVMKRYLNITTGKLITEEEAQGSDDEPDEQPPEELLKVTKQSSLRNEEGSDGSADGNAEEMAQDEFEAVVMEQKEMQR